MAYRKKILIGITLLLLIIVIIPFFLINGKIGIFYPSPTPTLSLPDGLGTIKTSNGEVLGVNDGSFAPIDIGRNSQEMALKQRAAQQLQIGSPASALAYWQFALSIESNDAEALIYTENLRVAASGLPYNTLIAGTAFTYPFPDIASESILQGIYVAQHEYNQNHASGIQLRVLIANSGSNVTDTTAIAQQIVRIAARDHTVIGVIGWLRSSNTLTALSILANAKIPLISPQSTSDVLSGISPYFFRIVPPNRVEAQVATQFAQNTLHVTRPVIFVDTSDVYSQNLAQDFKDQFLQNGHVILHEETFTTGKIQKEQYSMLIQDALKYQPDSFIFTSASNVDAAYFQDALPTSGPFAHIPVLAGSNSYTVYPSIYGRWYFTAFAFHDMSNIPIAQQFAQDYSTAFNAHSPKPSGIYGYTLADDHAILAFDATSVTLAAISMTNASDISTLTPQILVDTLPQISGAHAFQGVSGQIAFGSNHDPINKAIVILFISEKGVLEIKNGIGGCFTKGSC